RRARGAVAPVHRGRPAERRRTADRPGPAGGLAGRPVPRHPDDAVRPADSGPGAARADAPRAAAGDDAAAAGSGSAAPAARLGTVPVTTMIPNDPGACPARPVLRPWVIGGPGP